MTYNFSINQVKAIEWGLNPAEAIVFDFLFNVPTWAERVTVENIDYYFISRYKVLKEAPVVTDKPDTIYRHFKSLEKKGVIFYKKITSKDCIAIAEKGKLWRNTNKDGHFRDSEINPNELGKISESNSEINPTNNSTSIDNNNQGLEVNFNSDELPHTPPKKSINGKTQTLFKNKEEKPKNIPRKKDKKEKWPPGVFTSAKAMFDENYRQWQRNCGLTVNGSEGVYWNAKEIGQLGNLMRMLRDKAKSSGQIYHRDKTFVDRALSMFLQTASNLTNCWYMDKFTPTNFVSNFESIYVDIKKNLSNGYTGDKKKSKEQVASESNQQSLEALKMLREENSY